MGVLRGGRPGCPAGFEPRARLANVVRRGRLNYPFVYDVGLGGGTGLKCASGICRVEASGVGESAGCVAWVGFESLPRLFFHSKELPVQYLTVRCRAKCSGECGGYAPGGLLWQPDVQGSIPCRSLPGARGLRCGLPGFLRNNTCASQAVCKLANLTLYSSYG